MQEYFDFRELISNFVYFNILLLSDKWRDSFHDMSVPVRKLLCKRINDAQIIVPFTSKDFHRYHDHVVPGFVNSEFKNYKIEKMKLHYGSAEIQIPVLSCRRENSETYIANNTEYEGYLLFEKMSNTKVTVLVAAITKHLSYEEAGKVVFKLLQSISGL